MMFFAIVGAAFGLVLLLAWLYDRKQKRRGHMIRDVHGPENDTTLDAPKTIGYTQNIQGMGNGMYH